MEISLLIVAKMASKLLMHILVDDDVHEGKELLYSGVL